MKSCLAAVVVLAGLTGCGSAEETSLIGPVLPGDSAPEWTGPLTPPSESEDDTSLENWKSSVLDRADDDTVALIRRDLESRIKRMKESDERLSFLPPGIAHDERGRLARRIAFEERRLKMVDER